MLRQAKAQCDFLIAGVVADEVLIAHKGVTPVVPLAGRLEIVRNILYVDAAFPAMIADELESWRMLQFNVVFKSDDWHGTENGERLERDFKAVGVEVVYFRYTMSNSSNALRQKLRAVDLLVRNDTRPSDCSSFAAVWKNMTEGSRRSINPVWPTGD